MFDSLVIQPPKRSVRERQGWDGFFPYYAGYPESFARSLLRSAALPKNAVILDPWNGSGTTTYSASQLGFASHGLDINPVMVIIARARLLATSEADAVLAVARDLIRGARADSRSLNETDPLLWWFAPSTAALLRDLERRIRSQLVGERTITPNGVRLENMASLAATFYVALFAVCRDLSSPFRSSNPTWLRRPKDDEDRVQVDRAIILSAFTASIEKMVDALAARIDEPGADRALADIRLADTTSVCIEPGSIDMVLTSPPYCTRIDYSTATRMELAILDPLVHITMEDLGRQMTGSTRVPGHKIEVCQEWGSTCTRFLDELKRHPSKASSTYYYKTHLDYFDKMAKSIRNVAASLKKGGCAVLVVQDSFYKDVHNDLPTITAEMANAAGLAIGRRDDFHYKRSMSGINPRARNYKRAIGAVESVLCFEKIA